MNRAILMGRLTKDPEIQMTRNNVEMTKFTLACDRDYKDADGTIPTDFIPCVAWRHTAKFAHRYFKKGQRMLVEGTIRPHSWIGDDGQRRYMTQVVVNQIYFCESKNSSSSYDQSDDFNDYSDGQMTGGSGDGFLPDMDEDETALPFDMT